MDTTFPHASLMSLWVFLLFFFIPLWTAVGIGNKKRGQPIQHKPDSAHPGMIITSLANLALIALLVFTPIVLGPLFWSGVLLEFIAILIALVAVSSFVKSGPGLNTLGLYRFSRNPMYVGFELVYIAMTLLCWQSAPPAGMIALGLSLIFAVGAHLVVLNEERFLEKEYSPSFLEYKAHVRRYF